MLSSYSPRDEFDIERRLERIECNITYYPPRDDLVAVVEAVASNFDLLTPLFTRFEVVEEGLYSTWSMRSF